jgi:hypothetical protein
LDLIDMAIHHAEANGGWKMGQHRAYTSMSILASLVASRIPATIISETILPHGTSLDFSLSDLAIDASVCLPSILRLRVNKVR